MIEPSREPFDKRRLMIRVVKMVVMVVVLAAVLGTLRQGLAELQAAETTFDWRWFLAGGGVYLLGLMPMAWFWQRVLCQLQQPSQTSVVLRAYYLGHLGKYVPGKAMVIFLRAAAIRGIGGQTTPITASIFVETLTFMAVGGVLAGGLLAFSPTLTSDRPWLLPLALLLAVASFGPTLPPVMNWLIAKFGVKEVVSNLSTNSESAETASLTSPQASPQVSWGLLALGWLGGTATWCGLAGSLGLLAHGVGAELAATPEVFKAFLLAASLPVVAGFLSLLPGGLLVRDGLMVELLAPMVGAGPALATAVASRVVWLAAEIFICVILEVRQRLFASGN